MTAPTFVLGWEIHGRDKNGRVVRLSPRRFQVRASAVQYAELLRKNGREAWIHAIVGPESDDPPKAA